MRRKIGLKEKQLSHTIIIDKRKETQYKNKGTVVKLLLTQIIQNLLKTVILHWYSPSMHRKKDLNLKLKKCFLKRWWLWSILPKDGSVQMWNILASRSVDAFFCVNVFNFGFSFVRSFEHHFKIIPKIRAC